MNSDPTNFSSRVIDADAALQMVAVATADATGREFFRALVLNLAAALDVRGAWVTEYLANCRRLRALAFWLDGEWVEQFEHDIDGTPCAEVIEQRRLVHIPDNILQLYPVDEDLKKLGAVSYLGVPLLDRGGNILGHLAVLDKRPIAPDPRLLAVFQVFATRATAEHQRLAAEARVREREQKLGRLFASAMDAILDMDESLCITVANPAAEKLFRCPADRLVGRPVVELFAGPSRSRLLELSDGLGRSDQDAGSLWIPGSLEARRVYGERFAAEGSLSRYELGGKACFTLIVRDVGERLAAEKKIQLLTAQTQYLQEELRALHNCDQILGGSEPIRQVLRETGQVAQTDATVLILGETGTGKELIARAIHNNSRRRDKPLIRVNCAAVPANLIESEFFGHEKGAFTGATQRRDGRFLLADGGTLFLDEIGELPIDLQVKLLRALQEGEFEPVGSDRTIKVDVRVIAATNRDLPQAIREGRFREDLYYRLNVFPIRVPPLRQRGQDIALLAQAFAERAAQRIGRRVQPLSEDDLRRLRAYAWPGNVRELENVIERAVITAQDDRLDLDHCIPETNSEAQTGPPRSELEPYSAPRIRTAAELEAIERRNILRALEAVNWKIAGAGGAGQLLGINPSTLRSRMKALGISRSARE